MRNVNQNFIQEKNKQENRPIFLYTIFDYDSNGSNLYFCAHDTTIEFGGIEYLKFPIRHEVIPENTQGQIDKVNISLSNVSRLIRSYLGQYDALRGKKISIKTVFADQLDDPSAFMEDTYFIDEVSSDQTDVIFSASSKFDILDVTLPRRTFTRQQFPGIPTKGRIYVG